MKNNFSMKRVAILLSVLLVPFIALAQKGLPSVEVKDIDGNTINVQSILDDGVPVILSFWYTTCKPCLQELGPCPPMTPVPVPK